MITSRGTWTMFLAASLLAGTPGPSAMGPQVNRDAVALTAFNDRVKAYLDLQKRLEAALPPLSSTEDPAKLASRRRALADAIRAARRDAKPGDICGEVGDQLRRIIRDDANNRSPRDKAAAMEEVPKQDPLHVNADYPERAPLATVPPLLLVRLPRLPEELEYRFMGRDLILRDVKANIIVDFIHVAVPTARK